MQRQAFFPFDEPYAPQADAMGQVHLTVGNHGYFAFEGPCGTGKTLAALSPIARLVKSRDFSHKRCVAATPYKQQIEQFLTECKTINASIYESDRQLRTIVLVGKKDLHPYLREDLLEEEDIDEDLDALRERTAELIRHDSSAPLDEDKSRRMADPDLWYSVERARVAFENAQRLVETQRRNAPVDEVDLDALPEDYERGPAQNPDDDDRTYVYWEERSTLETGGVESPLPRSLVRVEDIVDGDPDQLPPDLRGPIDPFFLGLCRYAGRPPFDFDDGEKHTLGKDDLLRESVSRGIDPHECMAVLGSAADVVICNYNHVFQPQSRLLTDQKMGILDTGTALILDEAHNLEERARDLFCDSIGSGTLAVAQGDLSGAEDLLEYGVVSQSGDPDEISLAVKGTVEEAFAEYQDVTVSDLEAFRQLLERLREDVVPEWVTGRFDEWDADWEAALVLEGVPDAFPEEDSIPLERDGGGDELTEALKAAYNDIAYDVWPAGEAPTFEEFVTDLPTIASACIEVWDQSPLSRDVRVYVIAYLLHRWVLEDGTTYHRDLTLERSDYDEPASWDQVYNVSLDLTNCIPADDIAEVLDELGGGVLMSATLEPLDVFADVTGLSELQTSEGREVRTASYETTFPDENRALLTQDLPRYNSQRRGPPTLDEDAMTDTRKQYARTLSDIASTHGNILIGMPSYEEADWLAGYLRENPIVDKPILCDESTGMDETDELLEEFTAGQHKVLTTSLRGTITEGVDYPGDDLHTAVVVGVPIASLGDDLLDSVKDAYADRFGEDQAFEYTYTIPAVRKARQCIGRVIRSADDVGVRAFLDKRYQPRGYQSVHGLLSDREQQELKSVSNVADSTRLFWEIQDGR